jgi:hypothetical protein
MSKGKIVISAIIVIATLSFAAYKIFFENSLQKQLETFVYNNKIEDKKVFILFQEGDLSCGLCKKEILNTYKTVINHNLKDDAAIIFIGSEDSVGNKKEKIQFWLEQMGIEIKIYYAGNRSIYIINPVLVIKNGNYIIEQIPVESKNIDDILEKAKMESAPKQ